MRVLYEPLLYDFPRFMFLRVYDSDVDVDVIVPGFWSDWWLFIPAMFCSSYDPLTRLTTKDYMLFETPSLQRCNVSSSTAVNSSRLPPCQPAQLLS
jgi:hypothetical protein